MQLLKGKVALITGCGKGIGRASMRRFAEEGAIVYANCRSEGKLDEETAYLSEQFSTTVTPLYFDIRDKAEIKKAIMRIKKENARLDILLNNAGVMRDALIGMVDDKTIEDTFQTNVFAMIHVTQMAIKIMGKESCGSIINLSSIVGLRGSEGQTVYASSKGAVATLTKTWARELVKDNIRVNGIAPGKIDTDMFHSIGEEKVAEQIKDVGMKRLGSPDEVANTAVFLASDLSSYVTGEIIGVNGGWFL
ncbi:MAG: SDR family oxidoreductase [Clostridiales bacterium]|nr:SDR family oxidoreductase [Clostridiales bacterium]